METRKEKQERALEEVFGNAAKAVRSPGFKNRVRADHGDYEEEGIESNPSERNDIVPSPGKQWTYPPVSEEDKAIYNGLHIHTQTNPLGLHTHLKGGKLGGGHTHSPQNRLGGHTHKDIDVKDIKYPRGYSIDGHHVHDFNENKPGGCHGHHPENFG